jgi:hypothetical protein
MAVSRPFLLAVIGVALLAAAVFAVQASRDTATSSSSSEQSQAQPAQAPPEQAAELSPRQALESAFRTDVDSARFDLDVSFAAEGETGSIELSGAGDGSDKQPQVELDVKVDLAGTNVEGGFVTTDGKAWFTKGDTGYAVPQELWDGVLRSASRRQDTAAADPVAQLPFDPSKWVENVKSEASETLDGVETRHVSAQVDAGAAVSDLVKLAQRQAGAETAQLPPNISAQVEKSVKRAKFDVWVGQEDRILRRLTADLELALPGSGPAELALELNLTDVGEPQDIEAPARVSDSLPRGELGALIRTVLEGSTLATGGDPSLVRAGLQGTDNPRKLKSALRDNRQVVLFFANARALDDQVVEQSVRTVRARTKAVVLTDLVTNVERYGSLVEDLGVNQTPAVVVIDRAGDARLIEGYVDAESLAQVVADAR